MKTHAPVPKADGNGFADGVEISAPGTDPLDPLDPTRAPAPEPIRRLGILEGVAPLGLLERGRRPRRDQRFTLSHGERRRGAPETAAGGLAHLCLLGSLLLAIHACGAAAARASDEFGAPFTLNTNAGTDARDDQGPQLTTDGLGTWVAVWQSLDSLGGTIGTDADILIARSTDAGASWTEPEPLNTNAATDVYNDWRPQVTTDSQGTWVAVWHAFDAPAEEIGTDGDILVARSTDAGASWTDPAPLNTNAASDTGADFYPELTTDSQGTWVAVWQASDSFGDTLGTDWDVLIARSTDGGVSWTPPAALNANAVSDRGDDVRPQLTTDEAGTWVAVWYSSDSLSGTLGQDWDILVARSTDAGVSWTAP